VSGLIATASAFLLEGEGGYYNPVRRSGIGAGQNQAAGNLLMILPLVFALGYRKRSLLLKAVLFGCASALAAGFALALSRSAFLAALAMGAMWGFRMRRLRDLRIVFAALALALVAYLVAPEGYAERLKSLESIFDSTERVYSDQIEYRADIYKAGLIAFAENPVIGVGTDRFALWAGQRDARMIGTHEIHNAVLKVAANQGLLGLVPYMALLVLTFLDFSRVQAVGRYYRYLQDEELEQIYVRALTAQVGFIGILTVAMFQPGTFWRGIWALFAVSTILVQLTRKRLVELGVGDSQNENRTAASESPTGTSFEMNP
jgi:O-antigen ligase